MVLIADFVEAQRWLRWHTSAGAWLAFTMVLMCSFNASSLSPSDEALLVNLPLFELQNLAQLLCVEWGEGQVSVSRAMVELASASRSHDDLLCTALAELQGEQDEVGEEVGWNEMDGKEAGLRDCAVLPRKCWRQDGAPVLLPVLDGIVLGTETEMVNKAEVGMLEAEVKSETVIQKRIKSASRTDQNKRRAFIVHDPSIYVFFEDWLRPLLYSIGMFVEVHMAHTVLQAQQGDIVFLVQSTHRVQKLPGVEYWFVNTEGPDRHFSDEAIAQNFTNFLDYCLYNVERHLQLGAKVVLWLPIVMPGGLISFKARTSLCMVGGANTERRQVFWSRLKVESARLNKSIPFLEPTGWRASRDLVSQQCALVVNVASSENNRAMPRLRIDVLWQYDHRIISEEMLGGDQAEYRNTVEFVRLENLVGATLQLWDRIQAHSGHDDEGAMKERESLRLLVQQSRQAQFKRVVTQLLGVTGGGVESIVTEIGIRS